MNPPPRAAVVGAGIAGLSCATLLQSAGFEVGVFDKSRGPSGRMSIRRGDDWQCDHGAQYFTARDPGFRTEVARWQHAGVAASWRPRLHVLGDPSAHVPDPALERFVGLPRMSAPCRFLADGVDLEDADRVRTTLQQAFADSAAVAEGLPEAQAWATHRWRYAAAATTLDQRCLWHAGSRIGLCGDWLNGGKVEGAWLSGRQVGERVAARFRDDGAATVGRKARE